MLDTAYPADPIFRHFAALNAVPRPSKQEDRVRDFMVGFGESLGLDTEVDEIGNVLIRKPASPGHEHRDVVALQAHLDMVHQKNAETEFDFNTEGIRMRREGDWVRAEGTTLGADNGIGVAAIMAVLEDETLVHGPLEALFTIDEETGMTGAKQLRPDWLKARYMLNLDTEEDTEITIGCAGGINVTARLQCVVEPLLSQVQGLRVTVKGLSGGHSGMDIHKGLGNANKLLARLLLAGEASGPHVCTFEGGSLRNAIAREATAWIGVRHPEDFMQALASAKTQIAAEYATTDPKLEILVEEAPAPSLLLPAELQRGFLRALHACPHGIYRMSPDVPGLVQTSNNLARVSVGSGDIEVLCLTRSSVDSEKMDEVQVITGLFELVGATVTAEGDYPGWVPRPSSQLLQTARAIYVERFGEEPHVDAVHAGLECGIIGAHYPAMEMISFGPNILGAHSPDERVQISSVEKFRGYLHAVLAAL